MAEMTEHHELLTAFELRLDSFAARVEEQEKPKDSSLDLTALKVDVVDLHKEVDELNCTDISMLWSGVDAPEGTG